MHQQRVAARVQGVLHRQAPTTEHVVRGKQLLAVEADLGKGVEAVENKIDVVALERGPVDVEVQAVIPVGEPDPLQTGLIVAPERILDPSQRQEVRLDGSRHVCRLPVRGCLLRVR